MMSYLIDKNTRQIKKIQKIKISGVHFYFIPSQCTNAFQSSFVEIFTSKRILFISNKIDNRTFELNLHKNKFSSF